MAMKLGQTAVLLVLVGLLLQAVVTSEARAAGVYADRGCPICTSAESFNHPRKMLGSLTRGVLNLTLGWTELFIEPFRKIKQGDRIPVAVLKSTGGAIVRTVNGGREILTFWVRPDPSGQMMYDASHSCTLGILGLTER